MNTVSPKKHETWHTIWGLLMDSLERKKGSSI